MVVTVMVGMLVVNMVMMMVVVMEDVVVETGVVMMVMVSNLSSVYLETKTKTKISYSPKTRKERS